jgi:hypothetical protein
MRGCPSHPRTIRIDAYQRALPVEGPFASAPVVIVRDTHFTMKVVCNRDSRVSVPALVCYLHLPISSYYFRIRTPRTLMIDRDVPGTPRWYALAQHPSSSTYIIAHRIWKHLTQ